ncbi:ferredoxin reductase [Nocardioides albus]|uniref:Ferredoxin-NADP reductase n=1 Tax=Nocardioides albus TaxID=1841 RepID=A0A7W5A6Y7_9ACTN|nr:ferredoxin reductase [Nocardioides albus]MBB3090842.1 ferredoxin-NADP reductase [Nocardioides albus]
METRLARTLVLDVPGWSGHAPGQHVDVRLTAEDGYTAQRSYSVASPSAQDQVELTVQRVQGGEVSTYLTEIMLPGDQLEIRGPLGGWFQWTARIRGPVLLVGGGSGVVPLMAMLRERVRSDSSSPFRLIYSARTPDHIIYTSELHQMGQTHPDIQISRLYTRSGLPDDTREPGRLRIEDLPPPGNEITEGPSRVYVCGPTGFVEHAARLLVDRGYRSSDIRTERFGS